MTQLEQVPQNILNAIRESSMLAYLWGRNKAYRSTLECAAEATTHGTVLNGSLVGCLVGKQVLEVGTEGWVFETPIVHYSAYRPVGDESYPAPGADIIQTGSYYTFVTIAEKDGHSILMDIFRAEIFSHPKVVGKVE